MKHETPENEQCFKFRVSGHQPVLLKEVIRFLDPKPGEFIIDGTVDGGSHAAAILEKIGPQGKLLGVDWDERMISKCKLRIAESRNVLFEQANYADLPEVLRKRKLSKADGLLLDLGFSSEQLESSRGFSFMKDEPLLMTYDSGQKPLKELLTEIDAKALAKIIFDLSGEKFAMRIAKTIKEYQKRKAVETSGELQKIITDAVPKNYERGRINPATRTFQALRIWVNDELGNLTRILDRLPRVLKIDGRIVIISFHSLEDGLIKQKFREMEKVGQLRILNKKPIVPSAEEVTGNSRSRSAKLRAAIVTENKNRK